MDRGAISITSRSVALMVVEGEDPDIIKRLVPAHLAPLVAEELSEMAARLDDVADHIQPTSYPGAAGRSGSLPIA